MKNIICLFLFFFINPANAKDVNNTQPLEKKSTDSGDNKEEDLTLKKNKHNKTTKSKLFLVKIEAKKGELKNSFYIFLKESPSQRTIDFDLKSVSITVKDITKAINILEKNGFDKKNIVEGKNSYTLSIKNITIDEVNKLLEIENTSASINKVLFNKL